jgi:hypothetical protein
VKRTYIAANFSVDSVQEAYKMLQISWVSYVSKKESPQMQLLSKISWIRVTAIVACLMASGVYFTFAPNRALAEASCTCGGGMINNVRGASGASVCPRMDNVQIVSGTTTVSVDASSIEQIAC